MKVGPMHVTLGAVLLSGLVAWGLIYAANKATPASLPGKAFGKAA